MTFAERMKQWYHNLEVFEVNKDTFNHIAEFSMAPPPHVTPGLVWKRNLCAGTPIPVTLWIVCRCVKSPTEEGWCYTQWLRPVIK